MRSATNSTNEPYYQNYVFDDIANQFNGTANEFDLKVNQSDVAGISSSNGVVLINGIFQTPGLTEEYVFNENSGVTSIETYWHMELLLVMILVFQFPKRWHHRFCWFYRRVWISTTGICWRNCSCIWSGYYFFCFYWQLWFWL